MGKSWHTHTFGVVTMEYLYLTIFSCRLGVTGNHCHYHETFPKTSFYLLVMFFRTAALRESQQVALDSELLDTMPKQYVNREEQTTLHLECRGSSGKKCQGAAVVTVQV